MTNGMMKKLVLTSMLALLAAGLSGCGRKGALEAPPSAQLSENASKAEKDAARTKPDNPFILDGLI